MGEGLSACYVIGRLGFIVDAMYAYPVRGEKIRVINYNHITLI